MSIYREAPFCHDPFQLLVNCRGYYECPKNVDGKRLGHLAGHTGTYLDGSGRELNYVSDHYYNFAMAEMYPHVLDFYARQLARSIQEKGIEVDVVLGAPMGGILLAGALGRILERRVIFAEKRYPELPKVNSREKSILMLDRHRIRKGDKVFLVEDVCNNFSTTAKICALVQFQAGRVIAIGCELNRSLTTQCRWESDALSVLSVMHIPTPQYRQDDDAVKQDIAIGNVIWKPKDEWSLLQSYMMK